MDAMVLQISITCLLLGQLRLASSLEYYKDEALVIMKRLSNADEAFDGHDVARVHLIEGHGHSPGRLARIDLRHLRKRSASNRQGMSAIQLHLQSGSKVKLTLKSAAIVDENTVISFRAETGRKVKQPLDVDCYSHGLIEDDSGTGWTALSHCDGLFGIASSPQFDYFLHPIDANRTRRDTHREDYDIHVMWRRSASKLDFNASNFINEKYADVLGEKEDRNSSQGVQGRKKRRGLAIELAMFSDAQYWQRLQQLYPGREDDFLLTRLGAMQALFSNRNRVGYDVQIKVKVLEYWIKNPKDYQFTQKLSGNLRSSCAYTRSKFFYDVHVINTGIVERDRGKVGLAYGGGACSRLRCFISLAIQLNSFVVYAHELGHTLGMSHHAQCPRNLKAIGGFMGGGMPFNFSPCMKNQLTEFLDTSRADCLFLETGHTERPSDFRTLPRAFPGQIRSPNGLCHVLAGPAYKYLSPQLRQGDSVCRVFQCLNENKTSPEYGTLRNFRAPIGLPCASKAFCVKDQTCKRWNKKSIALNHNVSLTNTKIVPQWSEWSSELSNCSRACGSGVRTRSRECVFNGFNLAPYCVGTAVKAELCNTHLCPGDPVRPRALRSSRAEEVCSRFFRETGLKPHSRVTVDYLPDNASVSTTKISRAHAKKCLMECDEDPQTTVDDVVAVLPDGTPCMDTHRSPIDLRRFKIKLRCVRGLCQEFTDCPDPSQVKDDCGICGGDGRQCFDKKLKPKSQGEDKRSYVTAIPVGSTNIYVAMETKRHAPTDAILEVWSQDNQNMIGSGGRHSWTGYNVKGIPFAGTKWFYKPKDLYFLAPGPTHEKVMIKVLVLKGPTHSVTVRYAIGSKKEKSGAGKV